jgi:hypothetical protein
MSDAPARLGIWRTIRETLALCARHWLAFLVLALVFAFLPSAYFGLVAWSRETLGGETPGLEGNGLDKLAAFILSAPMAIAVTCIALADLKGERMGLVGGLKAAWEKLVPGAWLMFLQTLGIGVGAMLLAIPGLLLALMWMAALPLQLAYGGKAVENLVRSAELTEGHRLRLLAVLAIWLGALLTYSVLSYALQWAVWGSDPTLALALLHVVLNPLMAAVFGLLAAAGATAIYGELSVLKSGALTDRDAEEIRSGRSY